MWLRRPCARSTRRSASWLSKNQLPVGSHGQFFIETDTAPGSAAPSSDRLRSPRSSATEELLPEGPLCRSPSATADEEIQGQAFPAGDVTLQVSCRNRVEEVELHISPLKKDRCGAGVVNFALECPAFGFACRIRRTGERNGCTFGHLPTSSCNPPEFRKLEAKRAILAARIARSSFPILLRLK